MMSRDDNSSQDRRPFDPRTTVFTNLALDEIMPRVSPNAWKIICFAMRKTAGWADPSSPTGRKLEDVISFSQFMLGTGIASKETANDAIEECLDGHYLVRRKVGKSFAYRLNISYTLPAAKPISPIGTISVPIPNLIGTETVPIKRGIGTEIVPVIGTESVHTNTNRTVTEPPPTFASARVFAPEQDGIISDSLVPLLVSVCKGFCVNIYDIPPAVLSACVPHLDAIQFVQISNYDLERCAAAFTKRRKSRGIVLDVRNLAEFLPRWLAEQKNPTLSAERPVKKAIRRGQYTSAEKAELRKGIEPSPISDAEVAFLYPKLDVASRLRVLEVLGNEPRLSLEEAVCRAGFT